MEPCKRIKYRAGKFSDEALREHDLTNPSDALWIKSIIFIKYQSVFARMKSIGTTRKKRRFSMKKEIRKKEINSAK